MDSLDNVQFDISTHRQFIHKEDICVLDYFLKLKRAHNISYDATSSTEIFYHKCNIIVLTQNKSINR